MIYQNPQTKIFDIKPKRNKFLSKNVEKKKFALSNGVKKEV